MYSSLYTKQLERNKPYFASLKKGASVVKLPFLICFIR